MKKVWAFLIAAAMILSFAACGGAGKNAPSGPDAKDAVTEAPQSDEATEDAAAEPTTEQLDDTARAEEGRSKLVGSWNMDGVDEISLVFNEDGTGEYNFLTEKHITFTYLVYITQELSDDECMIKVTYDTGDAEDFRFFFNRDTGHLCFHSSEGGGYNGVIDYSEWTGK
ncbi:MAG: hypothetical protein IJK89_12790 [Clostridia bacterium]|nr:hypothetical protein [Clostridia bacterium]